MDCFINATKKKYRFPSQRGNLTVEQLWDLKPRELDGIWQSLQAEIDAKPRVSLLDTDTSTNTELTDKAEIVKFIVKYKLDMAKKADKASQTKAERQKIAAIIEEKRAAALLDLPIEELEAKLAAMGD